MTNARRHPLPGHRDAERLLDAHGRHGRRADAHEELARLLADATATANAVDPAREHEALTHFRAAARRPQPARRSVRQRVAALSATAKVLSIAVGATATGGVAIASTSMPLPLTGGTRSHAAAPAIPRPAGTGQRPGPTGSAGGPSSTATVGAAVPGEGGRPGGTPRARHDRRHGRGVVPGLPVTPPRWPDDGGRTPTRRRAGRPRRPPLLRARIRRSRSRRRRRTRRSHAGRPSRRRSRRRTTSSRRASRSRRRRPRPARTRPRTRRRHRHRPDPDAVLAVLAAAAVPAASRPGRRRAAGARRRPS